MAVSKRKVRIFICYAHDDETVVFEMLKYMRPEVEKSGSIFWSDQELKPSDIWDDVIKEQLSQAHIVLAFVSQAFLNSKYITKTEIAIAIQRRKDEGIRIFPIILSRCRWKNRKWLAKTQFLPKQETVEFYKGDKRRALFLEITNYLLGLVKTLGQPPGEPSILEITAGHPIQGTLTGKPINHQIRLAANETITVELQAPTSNTDLELLDPDGNALRQLHVTGLYKNNSYFGIFTETVKIRGQYIVRVANGAGIYTLEVTKAAIGRNNGYMKFGKQVSGKLAPLDFTRRLINLSCSQNVVIELQSVSYNTCLELWHVESNRATRKCEVFATLFGNGSQTQQRNYVATIEYPVESDGLYMISVLNGNGKYALSVNMR